ncbi:hypothetical protein [Roseovarius sp. 2305UL8-3]|uniref:hypothetical protein n=1 Tax=Roseovarius conchicola TaxID=3121636 RepID=UPI0035286A64
MSDNITLERPAAATQLTPGQNAFITAINDKVAALLGTQLPGTFETVSYPPGFHPTVQYGNSAYYNSTMLDAFNGTLEIGTNGMLTLGNQQFSTLYSRILKAAEYQFSAADQKIVNDPAYDNQKIAITNSAASDGFAVAYAVSPVTYTGVLAALLKNFSDKPADYSTANIAKAAKNLVNAGFPGLAAAFSNNINMLAPLNRVLGEQEAASLELAAAQDHSTNPSAANGGLQTTATDYYVGWTPMPSNTVIQGGLDSASKVSIAISASNFSSTDASLSINGQTGFSIPIMDVIDIGITASSSYEWSKHTSSSSSLEMTIEYPGVTIVQIDPLPLSADNATGWYDQSLLQSIVSGSGDANVSGFKISPTSQYAPSKMFGKGKPFSRMRTMVISQAPTITMVFSADMANSVTSSFKESASVDVKLFGIFKVGSFSESYGITKVDTDKTSGKVTVVFAPPKITGSVPAVKQVANVLGGVADYPPPKN